ncbi:hypothetical protein NS184_16895, partial [Curtobacterium luteum]
MATRSHLGSPLHFRCLHVSVVILEWRVESHAVCSWVAATCCFHERFRVAVLELGCILDLLRRPSELDRDAEPHRITTTRTTATATANTMSPITPGS